MTPKPDLPKGPTATEMRRRAAEAEQQELERRMYRARLDAGMKIGDGLVALVEGNGSGGQAER